jgi:hypothetical protein
MMKLARFCETQLFSHYFRLDGSELIISVSQDLMEKRILSDLIKCCCDRNTWFGIRIIYQPMICENQSEANRRNATTIFNTHDIFSGIYFVVIWDTQESERIIWNVNIITESNCLSNKRNEECVTRMVI